MKIQERTFLYYDDNGVVKSCANKRAAENCLREAEKNNLMAYVFVFVRNRKTFAYDNLPVSMARTFASMVMVSMDGVILNLKKKDKLKPSVNGALWYEKLRRIPPAKERKVEEDFDESILFFE
jgi:hypothetical protein